MEKYNTSQEEKKYSNNNNSGSLDSNDYTEADVISSFKYFDINNREKVDINEIKRILTNFGDKMSEEEFNKIIKAFNINIDSNDNLDYIDFLKNLKNNDY